jgi:chromosome segregation ATPase
MKPVMKNILSPLLLLTFFICQTAAAVMYKWTDDEGRVHYGDRVPPEYSKHERKSINYQGRTIKVYEAAKTPEEKAAAKHLEELEVKKKKLARKRAVHDRSLLATYSSKQDMLMAQDGKIQAVESLIQLTHSRISSMQKRLLDLTEEAAKYERSGKELPLSLQRQITNLQDQITQNKNFARDKELEMKDIKRQFESSIKRFTELTEDEPNVKAREKQLEAASNNPTVELNRRDRTLLSSYSSEEDLLFARDEEISNMDALIQETHNRLGVMQQRLSKLSDDVYKHESTGEALPDKLQPQIETLIAEIKETEKLLEKRRSNKQDIEKKYSIDIKRYRTLTASK